MVKTIEFQRNAFRLSRVGVTGRSPLRVITHALDEFLGSRNDPTSNGRHHD